MLARGVLLADGKGVGRDHSSLTRFGTLVDVLTLVERARLLDHAKSPWKNALVRKSSLDGTLHRLPDLLHIVEKALALHLYGVVAKANALLAAVGGDCLKAIVRIDARRRDGRVTKEGDASAAHAEHARASALAVSAVGKQIHGIGVRHLALPVEDDLAGVRRKGLFDHSIRAVSPARLGKRPVKHRAEAVGLRIALQKGLDRSLGSDRMR